MLATIAEFDEECEAQIEFFLSEKLNVWKETKTAEAQAKEENGITATLEFSDSLIKEKRTELETKHAEQIKQIVALYTAFKKDAINEYIMAPENNGKKLHRKLVDQLKGKEKDVSKEAKAVEVSFAFEEFESAVEKEIAKMKLSGCCGSSSEEAEAKKIETALQAYQSNRTPSTYNKLRLALDFNRSASNIGYRLAMEGSGGHGYAFEKIFRKEQIEHPVHDERGAPRSYSLKLGN